MLDLQTPGGLKEERFPSESGHHGRGLDCMCCPRQKKQKNKHGKYYKLRHGNWLNYNLLYRMFCVAEALLFPFGRFVITSVSRKKPVCLCLLWSYDFLKCLNHFCFMDMFISIKCKWSNKNHFQLRHITNQPTFVVESVKKVRKKVSADFARKCKVFKNVFNLIISQRRHEEEEKVEIRVKAHK